jgi:hypothetical protein
MPSEIRVDEIKNTNSLCSVQLNDAGPVITGDITITTPFYNNGKTIPANYTINSNTNSMSIGPITINNGITVTVNSGGYWTII